jgi:hypothetical protein
MERYPAFRSQSHNVSKHVALMHELSRLIDVRAVGVRCTVRIFI